MYSRNMSASLLTAAIVAVIMFLLANISTRRMIRTAEEAADADLLTRGAAATAGVGALLVIYAFTQGGTVRLILGAGGLALLAHATLAYLRAQGDEADAYIEQALRSPADEEEEEFEDEDAEEEPAPRTRRAKQERNPS